VFFLIGDTLRRVLTTLGDPLTDAEVSQMIEEAGGDPVNYQGFVQIMLSKGN
jgi:Ca2+-binding EF-hand superfamily protein